MKIGQPTFSTSGTLSQTMTLNSNSFGSEEHQFVQPQTSVSYLEEQQRL